MPAVCARLTNGAQNEGPVNAASTSGSSSSIASSCWPSSARILPISRSSEWRRCHSHRYSSASGKRARTAFVRPWSLSHTTRGGAAAQGAEERIAVRLRLARERLQAPQLGAPGLVPHCAKDPERDPMAATVWVADPERQVIHQQRAARRPLPWAVGLEHDWGEHLGPVHHQLSVPREPQLAATGVGPHATGVGPQSLRPLPRDHRRVAVGRAGPDHLQRLGDPPSDELILARRVWTLVEVDVALAGLASIRPGLLARQTLGEAVRAIAVRRDSHVALSTVPRRTVATSKPHPRPGVLRPRTDRLGLAPALPQRRRPPANIASTPDDSRIYGIILHTRTHPEMRQGGRG